MTAPTGWQKERTMWMVYGPSGPAPYFGCSFNRQGMVNKLAESKHRAEDFRVKRVRVRLWEAPK